MTVAAGGAVVATCGGGDTVGAAGALVEERDRGSGEGEMVCGAAAVTVVGNVVTFSGSRWPILCPEEDWELRECPPS